MSSGARSTRSDTSAKSRAGRIAVPAKMTSSIPAPRIDLGEDSPITQRIASSTLDLPQPFGPTTPVRPSSIRSSAGSTKLLKPVSFSRFIRMADPSACGLAKNGLQSLPGLGADIRAVQKEGRSPLDSESRSGLGHCAEPVERGLVGETGFGPGRLDTELRGHGGEAADIGHRCKHLAVGQ